MKKILSLALALMMIMSMLVVFPVSAEDETTGYEIPRVAAGTITVDGDMDEAYENSALTPDKIYALISGEQIDDTVLEENQ